MLTFLNVIFHCWSNYFGTAGWYHETLNANGTSVAVSGMALDGVVAAEFLSGVKRHPMGSIPLRNAVEHCFHELGML